GPSARVSLARTFHPVRPRRWPCHATRLAESCPGAGAAITVAAPVFFFGPDCPVRGFDGSVSLGGSCSPGGVVICCHADFGRWGRGPPAAFTQLRDHCDTDVLCVTRL